SKLTRERVLETIEEMGMNKIGTALVVTLALAASSAWAQQMGGQSAASSQSSGGSASSTTSTTNFGFDSTTPNRSGTNNQSDARNNGTQGARGVVTGGSGDGGIALHSDAAKAGSNVPAISGGVSLNARDNL